MKIIIVCSDVNHPVFQHLESWQKENKAKYQIELVDRVSEIKKPGDILFLISCSEIVRETTRELFDYTLVLHASDLPDGRGWSPHIWDVINGKSKITLSLLNAEDSVDTGDIWQKKEILLDGTELFDEINEKLFSAELELMSWACENVYKVEPKTQPSSASTNYHRKRTPKDSEVSVDSSISEIFNLLRVCDPNRFPAYFSMNGTEYNIKIEKKND